MDESTQNTRSSAVAVKQVAAQVETALKAMAKLLVSMRFYPAGHPSLKDVTRDVQESFTPLFQRNESIVIVVRRTGFFYEEEPVGSANVMLQKLAVSLFSRKVSRLTILKDLNCRDLWETAKIFLLDVDDIQKGGGIQTLLQKERVTTLWANMLEIKGIFDLKNKIEEEKEKEDLHGSATIEDEEFLSTLSEPPAPKGEFIEETVPSTISGEVTSAGELPFEDLLNAVVMASGEEEFAGLLHRLIPVVFRNLTEQSAHLVLQTLSFLSLCCDIDYAGEARRKVAQQAITQLSLSSLLTFYASLLCARVRFDEHSIAWDKINQSLGHTFTQLLLLKIAVEEDATVKKVLNEAVISQGKVALPALFSTLEEDRWSVLRNSAYLLGEIRDVAAIDPLRTLLQHRDLRVRREALRALTRIGGNSVIAILARILQGNDSELRRQAMLCLGAIKNPATVPLLVQFIQERDWRFLQLEAKIDAIRALGEIGSTDVLHVLVSIVNNRCLFYRSRNDDLRIAALLAIGEIGGVEAVSFLEYMAAASPSNVTDAAISALKQVRKGKQYD